MTDAQPNLADRIARRAQKLDRKAFADLGGDPSRSALVLGSGRSGTTWVAEVLARHSYSRLIFEPFHADVSPRPVRLFIAAEEDDPELEKTMSRVLSGRFRHRRADKIRTRRIARSRVVKDIRIANLLSWIRARYPAVPVVYMIRHPMAASASRLRAGWVDGVGSYLDTPEGRGHLEDSCSAPWLAAYERYSEDEEILVRMVAEWCIENVYPLHALDDDGVALVYYENMIVDPLLEMERLLEFTSAALGPRTAALRVDDLRKPSAMDWFGTAGAANRNGGWTAVLGKWTSEVSPGTRTKCAEVLASFGLDRFYGEHPMPIHAVPASVESGS